MKKQLTEIWAYAQQVAAAEDSMPEPPDLTEIDSEKVKATVDQLNEKLAGKDTNYRTIRQNKRDCIISFMIQPLFCPQKYRKN
jgi:hypothetical protein